MIQVKLDEELLLMAIEIERNGRTFYAAAAERIPNHGVGDKFVYLAGQEQQHENTFKDMLRRINGRISAPEAKYQYIKDLAGSNIFTPEKVQEVLSRKTMTDVEAIEMGIASEKDSILFYSDIRGMFPADEQHLVDAIINEEKKHLSELSYMQRQLLIH